MMGLFGKKSSACEVCGEDTRSSIWMYCDDCELELDIAKGESGDIYQSGVVAENQRITDLLEEYLMLLKKSEPSNPEIAGLSKALVIVKERKAVDG